MSDQFEEIFKKRSDEIKPSLERIKEAWYFFDLPNFRPDLILVAGTNGKGGTAGSMWQLASAIFENCGLYTSPHVSHFSERIQSSKIDIDDAFVVRALEDLKTKIPQETYDRLSFFELTTLLAFCIFRKIKTDFIVCEVGLGGRWDATNITEPAISVITGIDFDHQAFLGNSLESIAKEKIGVARPGKALFWGESDTEKNGLLNEILTQEQKRIGFDLMRVGHHFGRVDDKRFFINFDKKLVFNYPKFLQAKPRSLAQNFVLAFAVLYHHLRQIKKLTFDLSLDKLNHALKKFDAPDRYLPISFFARFQYLHWRQHKILLDICHNPQSVANFTKTWSKTTSKKIPALISILGDKDLSSMLHFLEETFFPIIFFAVKNNRNFDSSQLAKRVPPIPYAADFDAAWHQLTEKPNVDTSTVAVCGSFLAVNAAVDYFAAAPPAGKLPQTLIGTKK